MFASSSYPSRIEARELPSAVIWERRLPGGGFSRIIAYTERDGGEPVVIVHQRTRANGQKTQADPKLLYLRGVFYWCK